MMSKFNLSAATILIAIALVLVVLLILYFLINYSRSFNLQNSTSSKNLSLVPQNQIVSGGPPPDGIPSIDNPKFVSLDNATFLSNSDIVIGINYMGEAKAYPLKILVWHEIVNDQFGSEPVSITYCPLCYSSEAFIPIVKNQTVTFGTSGKLYNNNLVMYDRLTKSLWSEMLGEAIEGNLAGYKLQKIPIDLVTWGTWKKIYSNTTVLSTNTGYNRPYGTDPYGDYYNTNQIYFPLNHLDNRLPPKTIIVGLQLNNYYRAYPKSIFNGTAKVITDLVSNKSITIFVYGLGSARFFNPVFNGKMLTFSLINGNFTDSETNSIWNYEGYAISGPLKGNSLERYTAIPAFWFAWAAFHPNTTVYNYTRT